MKFISTLLGAHLQRYPQMQLADVYKLLHQAAMGPGHAVSDPAQALERLRAEAAALGPGADDPRIDPISPDGQLARVHLRAYVDAGGSLEALANAFVRTAAEHVPARDKLAKFCGCLGDFAATGAIPFERQAVEAFFGDLAAQGYPVVHHSAVYREAYRPAYRVVAVGLLEGGG